MVNEKYPFYKLGELLPSSYKNGIYKSAESYGKGTSILRINDFDNYGNLVSENLLKVDLTLEEKESYKLGYNDIVINRVNSLTHIGKSILWKCSNEISVVYESNMMRIQPNESILYPDYLIKILQSENARNFFKKVAKQAVAQCSINQQDVKSLSIPLPPLAEQKKIAEILSTWDKAIETVEKLVANSQQQKKALMQQLLTGQKRLLDDNGVRFSESWEEPTLGEIANVYQPKTISQEMLNESGYPVYGANGVIGFYSDFNHETEQIAVTCRGSTCGVVNWTKPKSWITGNAMVINVDDNPLINKKYLYYVLSGSNLNYLISGSGQPQITGSIKNHRILAPNKIEQEKIAQVLTLADREIDLYQQQLDKLKLEKKALMQQLLTGQKRVKID